MSLADKMTPQQVIGKDYCYHHPDYPSNHQVKHETVHTDSDFYSLYDSYARLADDTRAAQVMNYRLRAIQAKSRYAEGSSNCFKLRPGRYFALTAHPATELNQQCQIVAITHHGLLPQNLEEDGAYQAAHLTNTFEVISAQQHW